MAIVLNGTTGITTPDINSTAGLDAADITGALPAIDGSALTGINAFKPVAVTGTTPSLNVGSYNFFDQGTLTAATTVSFASVPTNARWSYSCKTIAASGAWDITTAVYRHTFGVASHYTRPRDLFFKPDGTKMYVIGSDVDKVNEYDLRKPWDLSTASYLQNFSVATEDIEPRDLFFKPDGTKMYVLGDAGKDVNEYDLSTAWDISTASYLQLFSVSTQEISPQGIFFKPDGTKMYIAGNAGDDINEYDLSTAWNVTTATYLQNFSIAAQDTSPESVFFKPDGTKMYVVGNTGNDINEYNLSTAWNVTTASFLQLLSVHTQDVSPRGIFFHPDGTKFYTVGTDEDSVHQYELGSAIIPTFPAAVDSKPSRVFIGERVTYDFFTLDGGTTVKLIGEEIV